MSNDKLKKTIRDELPEFADALQRLEFASSYLSLSGLSRTTSDHAIIALGKLYALYETLENISDIAASNELEE